MLLVSVSAIASQGVAPVTNDLYLRECGACHMAYQPGLLPARTWQALLSGLDKHFNENAELEAADLKKIRSYVIQNSADNSNFAISVKIMKYLGAADNPIKIMDVPYMAKKHRVLENRLDKQNGKVSIKLSRCEDCHSHAAKGSYVATELRMPSFSY